MTTKVQTRHTPEEQEIERKPVELAAPEAELAEREMRLTTLQTRLNAEGVCQPQRGGLRNWSRQAAEIVRKQFVRKQFERMLDPQGQ